MLRDYLPGLGRHARQVVEVWPWPLLALSLVGLVHRRGPLLAPFLWLPVIPLLGVMPYPRFCLVLVPSLAVYFVDGASWIAERARALNQNAMRAVTASAVALAVAGLAACWWGPLGRQALDFEDGPIVSMRQAGLWLLAHGRPGARVLDRKPYVPYFARMEHVRMPDDDYETLINWAQASDVDYVVLEEYITASIRRQFLPLVTDEAFERRERRLRPIFKVRPYNWGGVAIYEVVREPRPVTLPVR